MHSVGTIFGRGLEVTLQVIQQTQPLFNIGNGRARAGAAVGLGRGKRAGHAVDDLHVHPVAAPARGNADAAIAVAGLNPMLDGVLHQGL